MKTIHAIYEKGVFRPTEEVDLPEGTLVEFTIRVIEPSISDRIKELAKTNPNLAAIYEIMSHSYDTGEPGNILETHNDHQP